MTRILRSGTYLWIAGMISATLLAQESSNFARGRVTGPDDRPVAGAEVVVFPPGDASEVRFRAVSDEDGRWRILGLEPPGRWTIRIQADGFFPAEGWFQVGASRLATTVDVSLRSLEERSPSFAENASTVMRWVEKGNALLEQGQTAAARTEYQKAVPMLPRDQRPELFQAIARTHYAEGDVEAAIEALQSALAIAPDDARLGQLFRGVLDAVGRADEAEALLSEAVARGAAQADAEPSPTPSAQLPELSPLVDATPGRTGRFRTAFGSRSPLSAVSTYLERFEMPESELRSVDAEGGSYDLGEESFAVYVPDGYDGSEKYGVLVYVSPTPRGGFRNPEFGRILAERKLIWIGAHNSGNQRWGWYRVGLALDAVHNLRELYAIDDERVFVSGYSGGGRVASQLTMLYPEVFRGGFFLYGCDYFENLSVPDRPGASWPARFPEPDKATLGRLKAESSFVLLTGDWDFNRAQTKRVYQAMDARGFERLTYLQIPQADHYHGLPPEWLVRGLDALDGTRRTP